MDLFKIANGPWEKLFDGTFQGHEVQLYSNPEKIMLVAIYEKKLDIVEGVIVELYKVFYANGEVESFTQSLPKDAMIITKHNEKENLKFLLLGSKPLYVKWNEEEFIKEVDLLVKRLSTSSEMIMDVSKAYSLSLTELWDAPKEAKTAFFSEPMLVPLLATSSHTMALEQPTLKAITKGEIILGTTKDGKPVNEPMAFFTKCLVTEGSAKERSRVLQVIGESALISNVPTIFFDTSRKFEAMSEASKQAEELKKQEVGLDAMGFSIRTFRPGKNIKADLNLIKAGQIAEIVGAGDRDFPRIVNAAAASKPALAGMQELIERVSSMQQTEEFTEFKIAKAARVLRVVEMKYPSLFGGQNEIAEMLKAGSGVGKASIIEADSLDLQGASLLTYTLVKGIYEYAKGRGKAEGIGCLLIIPDINLLGGNGGAVPKEIAGIFKEFSDLGVAYAIGSEHLIDVDAEIKKDAAAKINIIAGNDAGVQVANRKAYRVIVRPTLSKEAA